MKKLLLLSHFLLLSPYFLFSQNVGIGTTTPIARLHVADSAVVFTNNTTYFGLFTPPPVQGKGIRMMWYPQKGAFRVGAIDDGPLIGDVPGSYPTTDWNKDSIGIFSFATGYNTRAKGITSFASGLFNVASGYSSTAMGLLNTASGNGSTVMGEESEASGTLSTAIGTWDTASGYLSLAMGQEAVASNSNSIAIGYKVKANGSHSTAMGTGISNNGMSGSFAIGDGNTSSTLGNTSAWQMMMRFGGGYRFHVSDATMAVAIDIQGRVGIGTVSPNYPLTFNTDLGDKIALWSVSPYNYGFGVQSSLLQIHSDSYYSDIGFGYGHSLDFTERMRIKGNGNVGIGLIDPVARLHVVDSSVVFSATDDVPATPGNPPIVGAGRRMMWYPDKAAFRVGYTFGTNWDKNNIGVYSFAAGYNSKAKGQSSAALGFSEATGNYSFASGSSIAQGDYSFSSSVAFATGLGSTAMGASWAQGESSTAIGTQNHAVGYYSTAMGFNSVAAADYSITLGYNTTATGDYSTALGVYSTASGNSSLAAGLYASAKAAGSCAFGLYNDNTDTPDPLTSNPTDRIFQVGNGAGAGTRKNAMTILRKGHVGIGTLVPLARLHVTDSSVLFSAIGDIPASPGPTPQEGAGRRMMWYPDKAAFRAGYSNGTNWDKDSTGIYSVAFGFNSKAKGVASFAAGGTSYAMGVGSVALGSFVNANANNSTAIGNGAIANGENSTALGYVTTASGDYSTATGLITYSKAFGSFSAGLYNDVSDNPNPVTAAATDRIFQIGNGAGPFSKSNAVTILRNGNTGIGTVNPGSRLHIAFNNSGYIGGYVQGMTLESNTNTYLNFLSPNSNESGILFGKVSNNAHGGIIYNNSSHLNGMEFRTNGNATQMVLTDNGNLGVGASDPVFRLDVGDRMRIRAGSNSAGLWLNNDINSSSPAFIGMKANDEVGFYGQTGTPGWRFYVNTTTGNGWMAGTLTQASDQRLKKNIVVIDNSLQKLIQLHGYHYHWKDPDKDNALQTGVLAQEVQKLFPELVTANKDGILAVNYSGLIPVIIESIKEQQLQIDKLIQLNSIQQTQIEELKKLIQQK